MTYTVQELAYRYAQTLIEFHTWDLPSASTTAEYQAQRRYDAWLAVVAAREALNAACRHAAENNYS